MYHVNIFRLLFNMNDELYRIKHAEKLTGLWKRTSLLVFLTMLVYGWMAYLGLGSNAILNNELLFGQAEYESSKFWFMIGRAAFGVIYAIVVIFIPVLIFRLFARIPLRKLIVMQLVVLLITLVERLLWVPLTIFAGLDWYVSPLSLGIMASYVTSKTWLIYFFGAITLFQVWIMIFQVKFLSRLLDIKKIGVWISVFLLHFFEWWLIALVTFIAPYLIGRWF